MILRRQFLQLALAGGASTALASKIRSVVRGLHIGIQTFSLRGLRYPELVSAVAEVGVGECELFATQVEPTAAEAPDIMKWRDTISLDFFEQIRKRFGQAGIAIYTYNGRFGVGPGRGARGAPGGAAPATPPPPAAALTDAQIDRVFAFTKALGAKTFSSQMTVDMAKRVAPFAAKHKVVVAVASPNPDLLVEIPPISPWLRMDVDIGDMTRAGHDALAFVKDNYQHLLDVHLKDCKFQGASVPFGTGDSHMKEVLQFLASRKTAVRANIDCDYPGTGSSVDEVKKCYAYVRSCLA